MHTFYNPLIKILHFVLEINFQNTFNQNCHQISIKNKTQNRQTSEVVNNSLNP